MASLADIRARLESLNRRTTKANDIWKPKDEHEVRLLPYPFADDPFLELHFHYEIGDNPSILCPKANFADECAICDFCDMLKSWKTPEGAEKAEKDRKADWELFKKIQPKARVFVPMVERGKENEGAKFWGITANQAGELLEICTDGDRMEAVGADATSALKVLFGQTAFDIKVSFAKPGEKGNSKSFAMTTFTGKIKPTPLTKDPKLTQTLLSSVKNIKDVYPRVPSAEVEKMFKKFAGSAGGEAPVGDSGKEYTAKPQAQEQKPAAASNSKENAKLSGTRSIDEAFGDMIGGD